ncbi:adenylyltransferase/cytidyltransferase family protein [Alicyclobacillus mengziensis]|uniref:FAD synthase n=1 Tax=Alicyclobacillus mengziensis TaxID=2931921 RepID=A0A9X7Z772_9BACL|nr:adenylyltransferase/cytidyltransferase family protein [Alicyclobacillus mengziensis]QSO47131.1 adenylyltransferase/cytidyltransferase family protein [Alicyclobacillus mengziensis]
MNIIQVAYEPPPNTEGLVLCLGKFDGIHVGHQALLRVAKQYADIGQLAVMTFDPHPLWALKRDPDFQRALTPIREKRRLLEQYGVTRVYEVNFTKEYAQTSPETFVLEHLAALNLKRIVVGEGFNFGKGEGDRWFEPRLPIVRMGKIKMPVPGR